MGRRVLHAAALGGLVGALLACAPIALAGPECTPVRTGVRLPGALDESSGVAQGLRDPSVLWTHNDDGSVLFAVDPAGALLGSRPVRPRLGDWEDLAVAPCQSHGSCVYMADTGDNAERRPPGGIRVLRIPEPEFPLADEPVSAEVFPLRLPDGARDIEALFVLPGERVYLITKGRNHAVTLYRYPGPLRPDTVTMEEVQRLTSGAQPLADQVTGAAALADSGAEGATVAVRTYQSLSFYHMGLESDSLMPLPDGLVNLRTLEEAQGEAVALGPNGLVVLTSEAGFFGAPGSMNVLRCASAASRGSVRSPAMLP